MALLERYLQSVRFWLPKAQRQDILNELGEDLRAQLDDRASELGRGLSDPDVEAILTRCGHPRLVAERYLPQRYLIGPALLPVYTFLLKLVGFGYLLPWLLVWIGFLTFDPSYRLAHGVSDGLIAFWLQALHLFVAITGLTALAERRQLTLRLRESWDAHAWFQGHRTQNPDEIPRSESLVELVFGALLLFGWLRLAGTPVAQTLEEGVRVSFWPLDRSFYWMIAGLLGCGIAMAIVNLWWPWWTRRRAACGAAVATAGVLLVCLVAAAGPLIDVTVFDQRTGRAGALAWWLNVAWVGTLAIVGIGFLLRAARSVRRMLRPAQTAVRVHE